MQPTTDKDKEGVSQRAFSNKKWATYHIYIYIMRRHRLQGSASTVGQYITITGLGTECFKKNLDAISNITEFFKAETIGGGDFAPFKAVVKHSMECLKVSNRFLTPRINAPGAQHDMESLKIIDPYGHLRSMAEDKFIHSEDNVVQYYRMKTVVENKEL